MGQRVGRSLLALDVPSGLDAATGQARAPAIRATATATFIALKPGLLTGDGPDHCGTVSVHALDLEGLAEARGHRLDWPPLAAALPAVLARRVRNVNKGTFGTLGILGGSEGMSGALILAGRAALRTGAGKVWLGFLMADPPKFDTGMPELMLRHAGAVLEAEPHALVVGPGLGMSDAARSLLMRALALAIPVALDADALNLIARDPALLAATKARVAPTLATPHPGEAARILASDIASVQHDRMAAAREMAQRLGANVVLKGAGSVLAHPDGTWDINASGGPRARHRRQRRRAVGYSRRPALAGHRSEGRTAHRRMPAWRRGRCAGRTRLRAARGNRIRIARCSARIVEQGYPGPEYPCSEGKTDFSACSGGRNEPNARMPLVFSWPFKAAARGRPKPPLTLAFRFGRTRCRTRERFLPAFCNERLMASVRSPR